MAVLAGWHDRYPVGLAEPGFELFAQCLAGGQALDEGKGRRTATGHERGGGAVRPQVFLEQGKQGVLFQRGRFK